MIKCRRTKVDQTNFRRFHSPEIHLLNTQQSHYINNGVLSKSGRVSISLQCQIWTLCWILTGQRDYCPLHKKVAVKTCKQTYANYLSNAKLILSHIWNIKNHKGILLLQTYQEVMTSWNWWSMENVLSHLTALDLICHIFNIPPVVTIAQFTIIYI